jgi:hypothetical protein
MKNEEFYYAEYDRDWVFPVVCTIDDDPDYMYILWLSLMNVKTSLTKHVLFSGPHKKYQVQWVE